MDDNAWVMWLALALTFGAIEAATADLVFLMLAGGAVAAAVASLLGASFAVEVITAVVVATALLGVVRPIAKRRLTTAPKASMGADAYIGRSAVVVETVSSRDGRVKLGGEIWSARVAQDRPEAEPGREVQVVAISGATVIVVPVEPTGEPTTRGE
ncbi:MAG TPA: NfeD family protein [Dermatophilaceae bacterium]|nr:NfeD family protein [Dermatophilaceae bacterium]